MDVTVDGTDNYVIGVDYRTLSRRAVVVRVRELLAIDEGTTIKQFKKELAWNAAYYKLAGGL